jgi:hypothetical protein
MNARRLVVIVCLGSFACSSDDPASTDTAENGTTAASETGENATTAVAETTTEGETETETSTEATETETGDPIEDPILEAEDFDCILDLPKVHRFRITNVLGDLDATLAVANSPDGGSYPIGTLIQLIPTEAMVKRAPGFAPAANDWEFFALSVSAAGTEILDRGAESVVNQFGGNCFDCHTNAAPQWDFVCEQDHGCDPLPFTEAQIEAVQNADPRCD